MGKTLPPFSVPWGCKISGQLLLWRLCQNCSHVCEPRLAAGAAPFLCTLLLCWSLQQNWALLRIKFRSLKKWIFVHQIATCTELTKALTQVMLANRITCFDSTNYLSIHPHPLLHGGNGHRWVLVFPALCLQCMLLVTLWCVQDFFMQPPRSFWSARQLWVHRGTSVCSSAAQPAWGIEKSFLGVG